MTASERNINPNIKRQFHKTVAELSQKMKYRDPFYDPFYFVSGTPKNIEPLEQLSLGTDLIMGLRDIALLPINLAKLGFKGYQRIKHDWNT